MDPITKNLATDEIARINYPIFRDKMMKASRYGEKLFKQNQKQK